MRELLHRFNLWIIRKLFNISDEDLAEHERNFTQDGSVRSLSLGHSNLRGVSLEELLEEGEGVKRTPKQ